MKAENPNAIGTSLRTALLPEQSLSGAVLVSGCNEPVEEPPVPTEEATPPPSHSAANRNAATGADRPEPGGTAASR